MSGGALPVNAFCVDLEEWFHVCDVETPYMDPKSWDAAPAFVEKDTDVLLRLLADAKAHGTFVVVGWIAEKYPGLIRKIAAAGHEIGCHGYYHRLVYEQTPDEFRAEIRRARALLREVSGQPVTCFRAPGFSMTRDCFWALTVLAEEGFTTDISIVPASRDHGGVADMAPDTFRLRTPGGTLDVFPVSVMRVAGRVVPFSGGGYLRLYPLSFVRWGFRQNHRAGRPVMTYIHPREIDPAQPRLKLPALKGFKYYVGLDTCERKLAELLREYRFESVAEVLRLHPPRETRELRGREMVAVEESAAGAGVAG